MHKQLLLVQALCGCGGVKSVIPRLHRQHLSKQYADQLLWDVPLAREHRPGCNAECKMHFCISSTELRGWKWTTCARNHLAYLFYPWLRPFKCADRSEVPAGVTTIQNPDGGCTRVGETWLS